MLGKLDGVPCIEIHVCLRACCARAHTAARAHRLLLARKVHDADGARSDIVDLLDRTGYLELRRVRTDGKRIDALLSADKRFLREPRGTDDVVRDASLENGRM